MAITYIGTNSLSRFWSGIKSKFKKTEHNIPFVKGTQTASTNLWTGTCSDLDEITEGQSIKYYLPYAGTSTAATLTLTLSGGDSVTYPVRSRGTTSITTHFSAGSVMLLTFYDGYWQAHPWYDSNTVSQVRVDSLRPTANGSTIYGGQLVLRDGDGIYRSITNSRATGTTKTCFSGTIDDPTEIYYYSSTTAVASGSQVASSVMFEAHAAIDFRYSSNSGQTLTAYKPVYLIFNRIAKGDSETFSLKSDGWYTQNKIPPEGCVTVFLGVAYSTYQINLAPFHPMYMRTAEGEAAPYSPLDVSYSNNTLVINGQSIDLTAFESVTIEEMTPISETSFSGKLSEGGITLANKQKNGTASLITGNYSETSGIVAQIISYYINGDSVSCMADVYYGTSWGEWVIDIDTEGNFTATKQSSGSSGGTTDYTDLTNKPSINGVTLEGNKTAEDLGIKSAPMIEITYAELKTLRDNAKLVPGMQYRITDYSTVITGYYDLSALGASGKMHTAVAAGHDFDIIAVADDESHLNENARAALHNGDNYFAASRVSAWKLKYTIDNDPAKFTWANASGKGVIYWMEDEFNNRAGYDFKNIQFVRYALAFTNPPEEYADDAAYKLSYNAEHQPNRYGSMMHLFIALQAYMQEGTYVNPFMLDINGQIVTTNPEYDFAVGGNILGVIQMDSIDDTFKAAFNADTYYTFDFYDAETGTHSDLSLNGLTIAPCRENYIEIENDPLVALVMNEENVGALGMSVWEYNSVYTASLPSGVWNPCIENHLSLQNWLNTFGNNCYSNTFGAYCYSNTFGNNCYSNTFGNNCYSNTFGNSCYSNTFGDSCYSNTFGNSCDSNTFGNSCYSNTFGSYNSENELEGQFSYIRGGDRIIEVTVPSLMSDNYYQKEMYNYYGMYASKRATFITHRNNTVTSVTTTDGGNTWA